MTQEDNLECSHQSSNSVHDQVNDDSTKSKNTDTNSQVNSASSKITSEQIKTDKLPENISGNEKSVRRNSLTKSDIRGGENGGNFNNNSNMTVRKTQNSEDNIKEIQTKIENSNKISDGDVVNIKDSSKIETGNGKSDSILPKIEVDCDSQVSTVCDNEIIRERRSVSSETGSRTTISPVTSRRDKKKDDEDPITRLHALRANISSVLKEVKAVLSQHGEPEQKEKEKEEIKPAEDNVIRFKFVRRIKRKSTIDMEDENPPEIKNDKKNKTDEDITSRKTLVEEVNKVKELSKLESSESKNESKERKEVLPSNQQQEINGIPTKVNTEENQKDKSKENDEGILGISDVKAGNKRRGSLGNKKSTENTYEGESKQEIVKDKNEDRKEEDTKKIVEISTGNKISTTRRASKEVINLETTKLPDKSEGKINNDVTGTVLQKSQDKPSIKLSTENTSNILSAIGNSALDKELALTNLKLKNKSISPETTLDRNEQEKSRSSSPLNRIEKTKELTEISPTTKLQENSSVMDASIQIQPNFEDAKFVRNAGEGITDSPVTNITVISINAANGIERSSDLIIESIHKSIETENRDENIDTMKAVKADVSTTPRPDTKNIKENHLKTKNALKVPLRPRKPSFESIKGIVSSSTEQIPEARRSSLPASIFGNIAKSKFIAEYLPSHKRKKAPEVREKESEAQEIVNKPNSTECTAATRVTQNAEIDAKKDIDNEKGDQIKKVDQSQSQDHNESPAKEGKSILKIKLPINIETNKIMALVKKPQLSLLPSPTKAVLSITENFPTTLQIPTVDKTDQKKLSSQEKVDKIIENEVKVEKDIKEVSEDLTQNKGDVEQKGEKSNEEMKGQVSEDIVETEVETINKVGTEEINATLPETEKEQGCNNPVTEPSTTKKPKIKKKVVIKRVKRKLSLETPAIVIKSEPSEPELEICEKEIQPPPQSEPEKEEEKLPFKSKSCLKLREYQPGDIVMYADRIKRTVKWKKATVLERVTSISYKLDIEGQEKSAHICYIKKYTDKKVQFGGKEYLEIDYAREESEDEDDEPKRPYSIWDRA